MRCARATWVVAACAASLVALFTLPAAAADKRTVVDSAGRRVEVPAKISRVFVAGGPASVFVYTLAPEKLLGWNRPLTPEERAYIPPRYANLPTLGRLTGRGNTANVEVMLASRPDVIIDYGVVNPTYVSLADRVQQQTGVPYLLFDGSLSQIPRAYIAAGESLGVGERAKEVARYAEGLLAEIDERLAQVPAEKRPLVYYARGPRGLQTGLKGSINVESLERISARNIAAERMGPGGIVTVSPEQLLAWNPEVVITIESDFSTAARSDVIWKGVKAVRDGRLYVAPTEPFPWLDFPPSVNRLIGLKWLGRILYPQWFPDNLREDMRRFYELFYHRAVDQRQFDALLGSSGRSGP
jgi:iron complex transport system substrate-binding protein